MLTRHRIPKKYDLTFKASVSTNQSLTLRDVSAHSSCLVPKCAAPLLYRRRHPPQHASLFSEYRSLVYWTTTTLRPRASQQHKAEFGAASVSSFCAFAEGCGTPPPCEVHSLCNLMDFPPPPVLARYTRFGVERAYMFIRRHLRHLFPRRHGLSCIDCFYLEQYTECICGKIRIHNGKKATQIA